ncbi:MAG: radical SAM protein [Candidatus Cloacimonetes bacterium]|nr:radical SAM protein [Candidatus Cloacimonadota bacterium]
MNIEKKINSLSKYYKDKYGFRVFKICLSTKIECPKRSLSKNNNEYSDECVFCVKNTFVDTRNSNCENYEKSSPPGPYQAGQNEENDIISQINYMIDKLKSKVKTGGYIAYFHDNTSLYGDTEYLYTLFKEADRHPEILELIISTRPDYLPEILLKKISELNKPITIEIGVQTTSDKSLKYLNRGHTQADNQKAIEILLKYSFRIGVHIILGIPGETEDDIDKTIHWINSNEMISDVKIHHLAVFKGSKLANMIEKKDIIDLDSYIRLLAYFIRNLRNDLTISRLFTSNLNRHQTMLNNFPGDKRMWINKFLNEFDKISHTPNEIWGKKY